MKYLLLFSFLCQKWNCVDEKLNLTNLTRNQFNDLLRSNLPDDWHGELAALVGNCYKNFTRSTYVCPGQAQLFCVVDYMTKNCPSPHWQQNDGCTQITSLAINSELYMFSQSRYNNLEKNLEMERRPATFMRNYFKEKCCDLPPLFNDTLKECGYKKLMNYHVFEMQNRNDFSRMFTTQIQPTTTASSKSETKSLQSDLSSIIYEEPFDPLDCCDISSFIEPIWRAECQFDLKWDDTNRFSIVNDSPITSTESIRSLKDSDVKIVPLSCEQETCVFNKLNITINGTVNKELFIKLLDNMTDRHPEWVIAKTRVLTHCLKNPLIGYDEDCEINKILSCTFDILSENCPNRNKDDPCKNSKTVKDGIICEISSSKYRSRHRRQFCSLLDMTPSHVRSECGVNMIYKLDYVRPDDNWSHVVNCQDLTESSKCLLQKMDVLNKYGFMDRFKMRDRIRLYSEDLPPYYEEVYKNVLESVPLYRNHCSTSRKLLNVIDAIFTSCPYSKLKKSEKCSKLLTYHKTLSNLNTVKTKHNLHTKAEKPSIQSTYKTRTHTNNEMYEFFIDSDAPPVQVIDLNPKVKPLIEIPANNLNDPLGIFSLNNDGVLRS